MRIRIDVEIKGLDPDTQGGIVTDEVREVLGKLHERVGPVHWGEGQSVYVFTEHAVANAWVP